MPTSIATDFINFSRGSLATVTDSDGKIKWAGHNLVVSSEQFDSSNWSKGNATVSPNTQVAPNGTTTADTVVTSNAGHYIFMNVTVTPGASYTFSFWAKRGTMTDTKYSVFDAINSVDIIASTSYYSQINSSSFTLVTVTFTAPATCTSARVYPVRDSGVTGTVFVWGAHVYRSDLGGMVLNPARGDTYYPTTPKNLLGYTEDFTNAYWFKRATAMTVESNVAIAPNGLPVADRINFSTQFDYIDTAVPLITVVNTTVTVSVWLKLVSGNANLVLRGTAVATAYMQNITVTSEWQRFSATFTHDGTYNIGLVIQDRNSSGFGSVLVWGAQMSDSSSLDPYVPVYGAAQTSAAYYAPRIDYDPVTLAAKGLLIEEQRTNLLLYSDGTVSNLSPASDVSNASFPIAPYFANSIQFGDNSAERFAYKQAAVSATAYTLSIYVKMDDNSVPVVATGISGSGNDFGLILNGNIFTELATVTHVGGNVYRVSATKTSTGGTFNFGVIKYMAYSAKGFRITGYQLEAGTFATSYIPTSASQVTKNADVVSVSAQAFSYNQSAGSIVLKVTSLNSAVTSGNYAVFSAGDSANDRIALGRTSASQSLFRVAVSGSVQFSLNNTIGPTAVNIAAAFASNNFSVVADGGAAQTTTTGNLPSNIDKLHIGKYPTANSDLNGWVHEIAYYPRRLTNTELQQRTL